MASIKKDIRTNHVLAVIQCSNQGTSIDKACEEVGIMFLRPGSESASQKEKTSMQLPERLALVLLLLLLLWLGLYPGPLIGVIQSAVGHL